MAESVFKTLCKLCVATFGMMAAAAAPGQSYPAKPIRFIVSFLAGGPNDILARALAQKLAENLSQQVFIDNRAGAGGILGTDLAAKASPDGYTILLVAGGHAINPSLHHKLPYDTVKDFSGVAMLAAIPNILVVHPSVPARSLQELVQLAKTQPGQLNFASAGNGTVSHLAGELLKSMSGINMVHVPYKGTVTATTALISGEVSLYIGGMPTVLPLVRGGRLRALGVTTAKRSAAAPDLPSIAESGVPGFDVSPWYGVVVPAGTPADIVNRLNGEIAKAIQAPDVKERLASQGFETTLSTPREFDAYIRSEIVKWAKVVKQSGARID
jgi:tripartite-type tricarboxylate transporter receptor subunit TctC